MYFYNLVTLLLRCFYSGIYFFFVYKLYRL